MSSLTQASALGAAVIRRGTGGRSSVSGVIATVTGATGFLGRYVVNNLGKMGSHITVPYRGDEHDYRHLRVAADIGGTKFMPFQALDEDSILPTVLHSNVVINLMGKSFDTRHFSMEDVNITAAANVARACKEAGVKQLIHVSALGADPNSPSRFLASKGEGERVVKDIFPDVTIVRPSDVFGTEDYYLNRLAQRHGLPFLGIPVIDGGKAKKMPVYCGDVAKAITEMIGLPQAIGGTYEIVGPKTYTVREIVEFVNETIRKPSKSTYVPSAIARFIGRMIELAPLDPVFSEDEAVRATLSDKLTGAMTLEDLDIKPHPMERTALNWLRRYRSSSFHDVMDA